MGLVDALRRAEEQARKVAKASAERTILGLDDAERAIRRRMRIYPKPMPAIPCHAAKTSAGTTSALKSQTIPSDQPLNRPKVS
jgi:hypothetical protein